MRTPPSSERGQGSDCEPPCETHLAKTLPSFWGGRQSLPWPRKHPLQGRLAPPDFPTMGDLWKMQDEKFETENEKEPDVNKKKNRNVYFCVSYSRFFSTFIHRVINRLKNMFNLSWLRVRMSYHIFNNLAELLNGDLAAKIGQGIFSKDLMDRECNYSLPLSLWKRYPYVTPQ